jgi:hypothetical protein
MPLLVRMLWCQMVAPMVHHAAGEAVQVGAVASDRDCGPWLAYDAQCSIWREGTLLVADTTWQPRHVAGVSLYVVMLFDQVVKQMSLWCWLPPLPAPWSACFNNRWTMLWGQGCGVSGVACVVTQEAHVCVCVD